MRILYLCTYYHRAMIFRDSMDRLSNLGHTLKAFNAVVKGAKINEKYKNIMDDAVIHKECFNKWDRFFYFIKQRKFYNAVIESVVVSNYDIVHSHTLFNGGYVCYKIKKRLGIPYVVSVRNTDINVFLKIPFFKSVANKIVKEASSVLFLSEPYKNEFINEYVTDRLKGSVRNKSSVIRNGLESFWLENKQQAKTHEDNKIINILCVGKIDENKNITTTIDALDILKSEGYQVSFTVVGQVIDQKVQQEIAKSDYTNVIGYLPKEELIKIYRKNDIYVMPSIHESFGRVYAEAMTQGLPVIYSKGQGFDGIYPDGHVGYSVPSKDPEYIAECIKKIIQNYSTISGNCIDMCDEFDWDGITVQLESLYKKSLEKGEK